PSGPAPSGPGASCVALELERHGVLLPLLAQPGDHFLQVVLALAADAHGVALDLRLHPGVVVADEHGDLLRQLLRQPGAPADGLAHTAAAGRLYLPPAEHFY